RARAGARRRSGRSLGPRGSGACASHHGCRVRGDAARPGADLARRSGRGIGNSAGARLRIRRLERRHVGRHRASAPRRGRSAGWLRQGHGPNRRGLALNVLAWIVLVAMHATILEVETGLLFIPLRSSGDALRSAAFETYFTIDLLVYVAILALAFASDAARRAEETRLRARAAEAAALQARLSAPP